MGRVFLSFVAVVLFAGCSIFGPIDPSDKVTGMWQERLPDGTTTKVVSLWLQPTGRATMETVVLGKDRGTPIPGRWSFLDNNELTVQLETASGTPQGQPMVFDLVGDKLVPKRWDRALYGQEGLPLRRRIH